MLHTNSDTFVYFQKSLVELNLIKMWKLQKILIQSENVGVHGSMRLFNVDILSESWVIAIVFLHPYGFSCTSYCFVWSVQEHLLLFVIAHPDGFLLFSAHQEIQWIKVNETSHFFQRQIVKIITGMKKNQSEFWTNRFHFLILKLKFCYVVMQVCKQIMLTLATWGSSISIHEIWCLFIWLFCTNEIL